MAEPINKASIEQYKKILAMNTLAAAQNAANAANMSSYSGEVGERTGAGGPLDISNVPMVAGLANRLAVSQSNAANTYKAGVNKLKGMGQYVEGQRQYMRWRYPSRYGISSSGQSYWSPNNWNPSINIQLPSVTNAPGFTPTAPTAPGQEGPK